MGLITKEASSPKRHHPQRGIIIKRDSSPNRHHPQSGLIIVKEDSSTCQIDINAKEVIITKEASSPMASLQNRHHDDHHKMGIISPQIISQKSLIAKEASSPKRHHCQRGFIIKWETSPNRHQWLENNQSHCYFLISTLFCTTKVWPVYVFQLQGNSNQDTNSLLRLPAINLDKSESPAPKILNWIQDNAMHSGKKGATFDS